MNTTPLFSRKLIAIAAAALLATACSAPMVKPEGADNARTKLTQLQSDSQLASRAPVEIKDAEQAVTAAEVPREDNDLARHLVLIADRKVDTAAAMAQSRLLEDQRKTLSEQRETARLDSRTREADRARGDAASARSDASLARADANMARNQTDIARMETDAAKLKADELQKQLTELNAKTTERGLVVTLGDVLFSTGRAELRGGTPSNLAKLAGFLNQYPDRSVTIEGHTDSVGAEDYNRDLSERRAASVKSYLVGQGVASSRLTSTGLGEGSPVAGNESATGRQQNRRVEVIIANAQTLAR